MSKIVKLQADIFKRLKAVEIGPDGNLVVIAGRNGQGKTSVLDAITAALGGNNTKTLPRPIRDGEENASIVLETEDLIVTRTFSGTTSKLTVKGKDGATYTKGQAKLDELFGKLSLDPLAVRQRRAKKKFAAQFEAAYDTAMQAHPDNVTEGPLRRKELAREVELAAIHHAAEHGTLLKEAS